MSNYAVGRSSRSADLHARLRLAALGTVTLGVVLLAAAAFVLSYEGIHQIALRAGVSPEVAKLYPLIFDAMLVIAGAAALALRGAGWWARFYAWVSLLLMLVALAIGNAVYATGTTLPAQPTKAAVAVTPWVLLLMAFGLLLEMLRYFRTTRSTAAKATAAGVASGSAVADANGGPDAAVTLATASGGKVRELPRVDLDTLLGPRAGEPPPIEAPHDTGTDESAGHQADPVSYGEETGYVHPDSYLDEGEYSPHGDTGGPDGPPEQAGDDAGDGTRRAGHDAASAEPTATAAETPPTATGSPATSAETPAAAAETTATPAETSPTATEATAAAAETTPTDTEATATAAETTAAAAETPATAAESPAAAAEASPTSTETTASAPKTPATAAKTPATAAEPPATPAKAQATPFEAPASKAATGAANGQAAGGDPAAMETQAVPDGTAAADQGGNGATPVAAGAEGPALERIRSTPTRPEE